MGNRACGRAILTMEDEIDAEIEAYLKEDHARLAAERKILLLGPGEGGKSTFAKAIKSAFVGFTETERMSYTHLIREQFVSILLDWSQSSSAALTESAQKVINKAEEGGLNFDCLLDWISVIEPFVSSRDECMMDHNRGAYCSGAFFVQQLQTVEQCMRFVSSDYVPSVRDVLLIRKRTCGIKESLFDWNSLRVTLIDVGAPRSERKKWVHCFSNVTSIVFCINLTTLHHPLYDSSVPRIHEESRLLEEFAFCKYFMDTPIVIIGTHYDLLCQLFQYESYRKEILEMAPRVHDNLCAIVPKGPCTYAKWAMYTIMKSAFEVR
jgi:GTPase SAR1 family protein